MSVLINADTSDGLKFTSDTSGEIKLQSAGADIATVTSTGITMASGKTLPAAALTGTVPSSSVDALSTASGSAPSYSARAWVNFNGTGTVAIRASGNVSSITDNGTGNYTVNFTNSMPDTSYAILGMTAYAGGVCEEVSAPIRTVSAVKILTPQTTNGAPTDYSNVNVAIFR